MHRYLRDELGKFHPIVDDDYLDWVRADACLICGRGDCNAHHVVRVAHGRIDYATVPLCREHHVEIHAMGVNTFSVSHGVDLFKAAFAKFIEYHMEGI